MNATRREFIVSAAGAVAVGTLAPACFAQTREIPMPKDKPFMYTDMSERDFIRWNLGYSMPRVLATWDAIPEEQICKQPKPYLAAPAFVFGNIAVKERIHHAGFAGGINDIPEKYGIFHGFKMPTQDELEAAVDSKQELVDYWKDVRKKTLALLAGMSDSDLKRVPEKSVISDGQPNRDNPIREVYVMSIMNQNARWGELRVLEAVIENEIIGEEGHISPGI